MDLLHSGNHTQTSTAPMIEPQWDKERLYSRHHDQEIWQTFHAGERNVSLLNGFGTLVGLTENRLPPGHGSSLQNSCDSQSITYMLEGSIICKSGREPTKIIRQGEFHCMYTRNNLLIHEENISPGTWAHVFRISLISSACEPLHRPQHRFYSQAERRGRLCLVASRKGINETLFLPQDVSVYSGILDQGQHVMHPLAAGRIAWLHVITGQIKLDDLVLNRGDGVGISEMLGVTFTVFADSEVILMDLRR